MTATLSPLTMYNPNTTCSTPCEELNTLSWLSSKIKLMVWSKPFSVPTIILPSEVITATVPENGVKESILRDYKLKTLSLVRKWFQLLTKRKKRKEKGSIKVNTAAAHEGEKVLNLFQLYLENSKSNGRRDSLTSDSGSNSNGFHL